MRCCRKAWGAVRRDVAPGESSATAWPAVGALVQAVGSASVRLLLPEKMQQPPRPPDKRHIQIRRRVEVSSNGKVPGKPRLPRPDECADRREG